MTTDHGHDRDPLLWDLIKTQDLVPMVAQLFHKALKTTPNESLILAELYAADGDAVFMEALFQRLGDDGNSSESLIRVYVSKLRLKLTPIGVTIVSQWGRGYRLTPESGGAIRAALNAANPVLALEPRVLKRLGHRDIDGKFARHTRNNRP